MGRTERNSHETPGEFILRRSDAFARELSKIVPSGRVYYIYNPFEYARPPWAAYVRKFAATPKKTVFIGMNPGPWGMAQTGIPFGEVATVREWLHIDEAVAQPSRTHPRRPVLGMACTRSEVSGRRLWSLFRKRFGTAEHFFTDHMVLNYCPLVFLGESGVNITPDRLPKGMRSVLFEICDRFLAEALSSLQPESVVAIGAFAAKRVATVRENFSVTRILHPSPASPAANRGWAETAERQLTEAGIWKEAVNRDAPSPTEP